MKCNKPLLIGTVGIVLLGAAMHFAFEGLGEWPPIGIIVPVNESVWEHLKLTFYPMLLFWLIAAPRMGLSYKTLSAALAAGIAVSLIVIVGIFYLIQSGLGIKSLFLDILLSILAAFIGQWIICHLLQNAIETSVIGSILAAVLIATLVLAFSIWTFHPPKLPIFRDPPTGGYGIYKQVPKNAGFVPNNAE